MEAHKRSKKPQSSQYPSNKQATHVHGRRISPSGSSAHHLRRRPLFPAPERRSRRRGRTRKGHNGRRTCRGGSCRRRGNGTPPCFEERVELRGGVGGTVEGVVQLLGKLGAVVVEPAGGVTTAVDGGSGWTGGQVAADGALGEDRHLVGGGQGVVVAEV
ncbi:hypothetical protein Acr_15g0005370 [Actinidia rufa]|uniref:Uncharacterized protein n=1 Tax=Actinidia rufa TaxID=165716 RepID=A0A7J0FVG8_9ERIC|nr:hypothetical protein Acr_15g0005370 [Actinidia rufa]